MGNAANIGKEMIDGLVRGYMMRRGMDRDDEERAYRKEQMDQQRQDRLDQQAEKQSLREAGSPLTVNEGTDTTGQVPLMQEGQQSVGGQTFFNRDQAMATAVQGNTPDGTVQRQAEAYRRIGKPMEALQLESAATQNKAAKFTLDKAQEEWVNKKFDQRLASISDATQLAGVLNGSPVAGGRKVTAAPSADGKTVDLIAHNDDGSTVKLNNKPIENSDKGIQRAITTFSQGMSAVEKVTALQHFATFDETVRHNQAGEQHATETLAEQKRHAGVTESQGQQQIQLHGAQVGIARQGLKLQERKLDEDLKNDPTRSLPASVKMSVAAQDRVIQGIEASITRAMADNTWDDKSEGAKALKLRLVRAQEARDSLIKPYLPDAPTAGDAPGGATDYMGYRGGKGAPGAPSASVPAAPAKPTLAAPQRTAAPAPAAAPAVDPMAAQAAQEAKELNMGQRDDLSPEVKAWRAQQAAQRQQQQEAERQEYARRDQERRRIVHGTY